MRTESCMSAGPNSVAPVSRPDTVRMAECIRCSMNGRASTMHGRLSTLALLMGAVLAAALIQVTQAACAAFQVPTLPPEATARASMLPVVSLAVLYRPVASAAAAQVMVTSLSDSSS